MQLLRSAQWISIAILIACRTNSGSELKPPDILTALEIMCQTGQVGTDPSNLSASDSTRAIPKLDHARLIYLDEVSEYPRVIANDNTSPAGRMHGDTCDLHMEIVWSDFYPETEDRPGLRLVTLTEKGKAPSIPGPMIRVKAGTTVRVSMHNTLSDSTATVFGLQTRPSAKTDSLHVLQGETQTIIFEAGAPGTYLYWVKLGQGMNFDLGEEEQLSGALIIDPEEGSPPDRVLVMNIFSTQIDTTLHPYGWLEALTINGKSWPFTDLYYHEVGDTVRWRVINCSQRHHPMHLHGFYYHVLSRGGVLEDRHYERDQRPFVVTENMREWSTISMEWITSRSGRWLFHCHVSFHVAEDLRLPGAALRDPSGHKGHMAGLVAGILVKPGPSDLVYKGEPVELTLYAREHRDGERNMYRFSLDSDTILDGASNNSPSPCLVLRQYQQTYVTVRNQLSVPTSIHWHGLEIDSWSDGVAGWSASDEKYSPEIQPGEAFTYKLALMRPGTFIYHSHQDDIHQLSSGLYGPLIVIGEEERYDPASDHYYIYAWRNEDPKSIDEIELNGLAEQPDMHGRVGEEHRLRLMNISPAGVVSIGMLNNGAPATVTFIAKDGADLPDIQRKEILESQQFGVGETADFMFHPSNPGIYVLEIREDAVGHTWRQKWIVNL